MLSTQDIKVRLESRLASLESELQHVDNAIHELNKKIITGQQVRSREWVVGCHHVVGVWGVGGCSYWVKKNEFLRLVFVFSQKLKALKKTCKMETKDSITKQV